MAFEVRDFETMVNNVLDRIVNANIGITNIYPGSVVRTIVESILAESDILNYHITQVYNALGIDKATGKDLDNLLSVLGILRKRATYATCQFEFSRGTPATSDILIPYGTIISTPQNVDGSIIEFMTTDPEAYIRVGETSKIVDGIAMVPGKQYVPANKLIIMNRPIVDIEAVTNISDVNNGTDEESDEDLRDRSQSALYQLGKGTSTSIKNSLLAISGVEDAMVIDMARGAGTSDVVVVTDTIPPSTSLQNEINYVIDNTKSAGIDIEIIYPTIVKQNIVVNTTPSDLDIDIIGNAIIKYLNTLKIGDTLIVNQMERAILNTFEYNITNDVNTIEPSSNVSVTGTKIIRRGTITINGVVWVGDIDG